MDEVERVLIDTQKEYSKSNRTKDKIIMLLIILMFLEAVIGYSGFVWYESQFDYVTTEQTTQDVDWFEADENKKVIAEIKSYIKGFIVDDELNMSNLLNGYRTEEFNEKYLEYIEKFNKILMYL